MSLLTGPQNGEAPLYLPMQVAPPRWDNDHLANRELESLQFIGRVLELAEDDHTSLGDRCRFLVLVQANLDAFLMVRGGLLHALQETGAVSRGQLPPSIQLALVRRDVALLHGRLNQAARSVLGRLADRGVAVRSWAQLDSSQQVTAMAAARRLLGPALQALPVDEWQGFPFLASGQLDVLARVESGGRTRVVRLPLPPGAPRLLPVGGGAYVPLEQTAAALLASPKGARLLGWTTCRVTRSAEVTSPDEDEQDVAAAVGWTVHARRYGAAVRLELGPHEGQPLQDVIRQGVRVHPHDVHVAAHPLDMGYFEELRHAARLTAPVRPQRDPLAQDVSVLSRMRDGDLLVQHPYDCFEATVLRFLREAATDPCVESLHAVLYRLAPESAIGDALVAAAQRGARVEVLLELRARFDEEHNAIWAQKLRTAGATVHSGPAPYKTHAKLLLVQRREGSGLRGYAHVGTGNYHEGTARSYEDFGLLTARPEICTHLLGVLADLSSGHTPRTAPGLVTAPRGLRAELTRRIVEATKNAAAGHTAYLAFKVNALTNRQLAYSLTEAAAAGVHVDLLVRSTCVLRPDQRGRIRVRSIVGNTLQHSRLFAFRTGDEEEIFLGSADLMPRNLDGRVEVLVRIDQEPWRRQLRAELDQYWGLRPDAWDLSPDGRWTRNGCPPPGSQH